MKLFFMMIVLFVLACVLYGIYAGVAAIRRGAARLGGRQHHTANPNTRPSQPLSANIAAPPALSMDYVAELQALFALHQSGAMTLDEFERLKQRLLAEIH